MALALRQTRDSLRVKNSDGNIWEKLVPRYSLQDLPEFDPEAEVSTPRSVAACQYEGILPQELTYRPIEIFEDACSDLDVAQLRFEFCEARRQDLLETAKAAFLTGADRAIGGTTSPTSQARLASPSASNTSPNTSLSASMMSGFGEPEAWVSERLHVCDADFPRTMAFFHNWQLDLSPFTVSSSSNDGGGLSKSMSSPSLTLTPSSRQRKNTSCSTRDPAVAHLPFVHQWAHARPGTLLPDRSFVSSAAEPEIVDLLSKIRSAPRIGNSEKEGAVLTEGLLVTKVRHDTLEREKARQHENRLVQTRCKTSVKSFDKLVKEQECHHHMGLFRDMMASPTGRVYIDPNRDEVRLNNHNRMAAISKRWRDHLKASTKDTHSRQERLANQKALDKMRYAHRSIQERLQWRLTYDDVMTQLEDHEEAKHEFHLWKEQQLKDNRQQADRVNFLRKELRKLRHVHRTLTAEQRERRIFQRKPARGGH